MTVTVLIVRWRDAMGLLIAVTLVVALVVALIIPIVCLIGIRLLFVVQFCSLLNVWGQIWTSSS